MGASQAQNFKAINQVVACTEIQSRRGRNRYKGFH